MRPMATGTDEMWEQMCDASEELAEALELGRKPFTPRALAALDRWVLAHEAPLDEEEVALLGLFLARVLVETHDGGLVVIRQKGHALDGEWAVTGFARGLANDYHVPFFVSAARIGLDRSLTAQVWYAQLVEEGAGAG